MPVITPMQMAARTMAVCGCCSPRVAQEPTAENREKPSKPRLSRVNGWSLPLHWTQVLAWVIFVFMTINCFGVFIPSLPQNWKYPAYFVGGAILLLNLCCYVVTTTIDPAEKRKGLRDYSKPLPAFDRSQHSHVIENRYCHLCQVPVSEKAKHCGTCNKCVTDFDHHCQWLNNCIGSRNYRCFICTLVSTLAALLFMMVIVIHIFIKYSTDPESLPDDHHCKMVIFLGGCVLLLCLIISVLVGYLFIFHLYLMLKKLSTYDFVKQSQLKRLGTKTTTCDQDQEAAARLEPHASDTRRFSPKEEGGTPRSSLLGLSPRKPEPSVIRSCSNTGPQVFRDQEQETSKLTTTEIGSNESLAAGKEETKPAALSPETYTVVQVLGSENSLVELHGLKRVAWSENSNQSSSQVTPRTLEDQQKPQQRSMVQDTTMEARELTLVQKLSPTEDDQQPSPSNSQEQIPPDG
ncbi:palmitoyltransferase ZDHHC11-like [Ochotona princeps]|uniref:palmitoyltransferase ZDHHC11-like n=1 Tax=Ochotona princeps TaxID=9978 RepID=UPI002715202B|nr:palmitoyltransferase ZDHHC11-like [Ochotona princeps]